MRTLVPPPFFVVLFLAAYCVAINGEEKPSLSESTNSVLVENDDQEQRNANNTDEFLVIQSNVLHINSPTYHLQRKQLTKREVESVPSSLVDDNALRTTLAPSVNETSPSTEMTNAVHDDEDGEDDDDYDSEEEEEEAEERSSDGSAIAEGRHDHSKKKKKKGGKHGMLDKFKKFLPKIHGPSMFMLGMAQANFNNFIMHALMMSKMALVSVIMMIIREMVFGDKDHAVKYYNFGYEPPIRPHYHHYDPPPPHPADDYPYDYKHRRRRSAANSSANSENFIN